MKCLLTLVFIFSVHILSFCQTYPGNAKDTVLLNAYIDSVNNSTKSTYNDVKDIIYRAKKLVYKSNNFFYAEILVQEGYIPFEVGDYKSAARIWDSAYNIFNSLKRLTGTADCLNKVGLCNIYLSNYAIASEKLFKGISIAENTNNRVLLSRLFTNAGLLYESLADNENALLFARKTIPLKQASEDTLGLAVTYNNIGNLYYSANHYDSAILYLRKACNIYKMKNSLAGLMGSLSNVGLVFQATKNYDSAIANFKIAEEISIKTQDINAKANLSTMLSNCYFFNENISEAGKYAALAATLGKDNKDYAFLENLYKVSYQYYNKIGNKEKALEFLKKLDVVKDTLHNQSKNLDYQKIAIKYELSKKVEADSLAMQQQVNIAKTKAVESENKLLIVSIVLLFITGVAAVMYNRSKALKRKNIIAEQEKQIEAQQKSTYQLKTLQAQMNPHFVFNCFNTIDSFILQNKQYEASLLVQRFSKLSRKILEQTALNTISFEEEIETLNTYLQIEKIRTNDSFDFSIDKEEAILNYQLPPMLLQPFVENAVVHGVRALQTNNGFIKIKVSSNDNFIEINIEDNGVGRNKSSEIKEQNTPTHRSMSMDLTLQRLKALHQNSGIVNYLQFIDFNNDKTGTLVTIKVPKILTT